MPHDLLDPFGKKKASPDKWDEIFKKPQAGGGSRKKPEAVESEEPEALESDPVPAQPPPKSAAVLSNPQWEMRLPASISP